MKFKKVKYRKVRKTEIKNDKLAETKKIFESRIPLEYLATFYRNQESVKSKKCRDGSLNGNSADYDLLRNSIRYIEKKFYTSIFHEYIHMSSTINGKNRIYTGFAQIDKKTGEVKGLGLTDGYINVLDNQYFEDIHGTNNNYSLLAYLTTLLNSLFKDNMETWLFNSDGYSLYQSLVYYMGEYYTDKFYYATDQIYFIYRNGKINYKKLYKYYSYALKFILVIYMKNIAKRYALNEITESEYEYDKKIIKKYLSTEIRINHKKYTVVDEETLENMFEKTESKILKHTS